MTDDLWPDDLGAVTLRAPVQILRQQASLLGKKTRNVVEAKVHEAQPRLTLGAKEGIAFSFEFSAPALGSYSYRLFSIQHAIDIYPLRMFLDDDVFRELFADRVHSSVGVLVRNEDDFVVLLRRILAADKTKAIIRALLAQSTGSGEIDSEETG